MAESCGSKVLKYILFALNVIFWLAGGGLLALGIWLRVSPSVLNILKIMNANEGDLTLYTVAYILIVVGAVMFIIGFCGCCGACMENKCLLISYAVFVSLLLAAQIAAGVLAIVYKDMILGVLEVEMTNQLRNQYGRSDFGAITEGWDYLQKEFKCCGVNGSADWRDSYWKRTNATVLDQVPKSCCVQDAESQFASAAMCQTDAAGVVSTNNLNAEGCHKKFMAWIQENSVIIIAVAVSIAAFQLILVIFAACLVHQLNREKMVYA